MKIRVRGLFDGTFGQTASCGEQVLPGAYKRFGVWLVDADFISQWLRYIVPGSLHTCSHGVFGLNAKGQFCMVRDVTVSRTLTFQTFCSLFMLRRWLVPWKLSSLKKKRLFYWQSINQAVNVSEFCYFGVQGTTFHLFVLLLHLLLKGASTAWGRKQFSSGVLQFVICACVVIKINNKMKKTCENNIFVCTLTAGSLRQRPV